MARNRPRLTYQLEMMSRDDWEYLINQYIKSKDDREIAILYYLEGYPQIDIAIMKNCDRKVIMRSLQRIMCILNKHVN